MVLMGQLRSSSHSFTAKQERRHVENVHGEQASEGGREAHRGSKRKGALLDKRLSMPGKAVDDAGGRVTVGHVGEAESGPVKMLSHRAHR